MGLYGKDMFTFVRNCQNVLQAAVHFMYPLAMKENSSLSMFSLVFDADRAADFGSSHRCAVLSHCCFRLCFPVVEHLFICLFATCISPLVRCLLRSLARF